MLHSATADIVDIGLNLAHDSFDGDRAAVLKRAQSVGVTRMIVTGSSLHSTVEAIRLTEDHPRLLRATAGVHPHHATELTEENAASLKELATHQNIVAVGECGLDYFRDFSPRDVQRIAFERQLRLGAELNKPLFLHQRDAHEDFIAILRAQGSSPVRGVAHCFTAGLDEARAYLDLGLHIGITGWICDERRGQHLKDVARYIPADRLLIETDAPYLLPRNLHPKPRDRRNEPMYLPQVLKTLAAARGDDPSVLGGITTQNALRLFDWRD
jgi:TatD DNase family protein